MMIDRKDMKILAQMAMERLRLRDDERCMEIIRQAMYLYPESAEPHNLLGLLRKAQGDRVQAMKHFRAALDLDPTYTPARQNMMEGSGPNVAEYSLHFRKQRN